jgi:hypothetical protein
MPQLPLFSLVNFLVVFARAIGGAIDDVASSTCGAMATQVLLGNSLSRLHFSALKPGP